MYIRESYQQLRADFVSARMSYMVLRGRWCDIVVLNVHARTEDKTDHMRDSFYEELDCVLDKFPKYHMKILLGDFNANHVRWVPCHHGMARPQVADGGDSLQFWKVAANI
jgi:hypothetical protein